MGTQHFLQPASTHLKYSLLFNKHHQWKKKRKKVTSCILYAKKQRGTVVHEGKEGAQKKLDVESGKRREKLRGGENRRSMLAVCQEFNSVTYIQSRDRVRLRVRQAGRLWIDSFVFSNRKLLQKQNWAVIIYVWISAYECVWCVLVGWVSLPPAGHLSGPRWSVHWRPQLCSSF